MSDLEFFGRVAQNPKKVDEDRHPYFTGKQARLLKATMLPSSEVAKRKQEEADRAIEFTRAAADEEFVNRTERSVSPNCPSPIGQRVGVITREPFEEQP